MGCESVSGGGSGQVGPAVITTEEALAEIRAMGEHVREPWKREDVRAVFAEAQTHGIGNMRLAPVLRRMLGRKTLSHSTVGEWSRRIAAEDEQA